MMNKSQRFVGVSDPKIIGRLSRSQDIVTVNHGNAFVAVNLKNGNKYQVRVDGNSLICTCPDSDKGFNCKHEIAVARDIRFYEGEMTP